MLAGLAVSVGAASEWTIGDSGRMPASTMLLERHLEDQARRAIAAALSLDEPVDPLLRPTTDPSFGDYQLNAAMALAKRLRRAPREIATAIVEAVGALPEVAHAEVAGPGFVNLRLDEAWLAGVLSEDVRDRRLGVPEAEQKETIVVDFSGPNIAKQMHVGHLRSTILGDAIVRLLRFLGHRVIGDNHLGDWGTQFGLLIVGMRRWGSEEALRSRPIVELERVYKLASAQAKEDEAFASEARAELVKLQEGDPENRALWQTFISHTREALDRVYDLLGVEFDEWLGESAYHPMLAGVVERLIADGIGREDQGSICVWFNEHPSAPAELQRLEAPLIVRKQDGAFLYSTTDIATILYRRDELGVDRALYVVDARQGTHFSQVFAVSRLLGVTMELEHIGFGMVLGDDGKALKTRDGVAVTLVSLLDEAIERARQRIDEEREKGALRVAAEDVAQVARTLGVGSVKYADLHQNRMSNYQFDFDRMISFKGNAMPYLNYAYARIRSIFEEGEVGFDSYQAEVRLEADEEKILARRLVRFGDIVHRAARTSQPHLLCEHLYDLARDFSSFYNRCRVLDGGAHRESRLALAALTGRQLLHGLEVLGIAVVERM